MKDKVDTALDTYIDSAIKRIDDIVDLLLKAEEAYIMSKNVTEGTGDWKKRRDGFRVEGNDYLNQAKELFNVNTQS